MPVSGVATFSDVSGLLYSRQSIDANNAQIEAPARKGWYILDLVSDQESLQFKMIVR